jgi:hypothetical protein
MLQGDFTGGSNILSLHLQWDKGTAGETWITLIGESPYSTSSTYTYSSGEIVEGRTYKFRYRALNILGWGDYSEQGNILAAGEPTQMNAVSVTQEDTYVKIAWSPSTMNGSPLEAYRILI